MNAIRSLFALLVLAAHAGAALAATAVVSGPRTFVVSDCRQLNVELRFITDATPLAVTTSDISSKRDPQAAVPWSVQWAAPQPSNPAIGEYKAAGTLTSCPEPGAHVAPLSVTFVKGGPGVALPIEIRRPEPVLDAPTAVTIAVELPVGRDAVPYVAPIRLREIMNGAPITITPVGGPLRNAAGELLETTLDPEQKTPLTIAAGERADLKLRLSETPAAGVYTTRVVLQSPALKQSQTIDVTLKARVLWWYLLGILLAGILGGYVVNVVLARSAALDAARIEGLRAAAGIARRASLQRDPVVQQRLIMVVAELEGKARREPTAQQVQNAVTTASNTVGQIEASALEAAQKLRTSLDRVHLTLPKTVPFDDAISERLSALISELSAIDTAADAGEVVEAQRRLDVFEQHLPRRIDTALRPWLKELYDKLERLHAWAAPAQAMEQQRTTLLGGSFEPLIRRSRRASCSNATRLHAKFGRS